MFDGILSVKSIHAPRLFVMLVVDVVLYINTSYFTPAHVLLK